ncbi:MAG: class I SAM-dependent rRNA methyltransferase, partial [Pedobacter sp.]|nr:class I SAM-dependent rRNA methyltransferase [Pedobacter sp.]
MVEIELKKGKEKAVLQRHPWIFSGAVEKIKGKPENGDLVKVLNGKKEFLGYGYFNAQSRVAVRLLSWDEGEVIDKTWYAQKIAQAIQLRTDLISLEDTNTCRLIFSEADFLPGLIVDQYADFLSVQILSAGIEKAKPMIIEILVDLLHPKGIFDRSDATARTHE